MLDKSPRREKKIKAWAVVCDIEELDPLFQGNGHEFQANIFYSRKEAIEFRRRQSCGLIGRIKPCTITLPAKRKTK